MKTIYACIWRASQPDDTFKQEEFDERIPRLMEWLRELYKGGHLIACGGGGFENHSGGLTLIAAESVEEAIELSNGTPMNEIGQTDVFVWDVFYAQLVHEELVEKLKS
jgi:uncharacterized protein YciI